MDEKTFTKRYHQHPYRGFAPVDDRRNRTAVNLPMNVLLSIVEERLVAAKTPGDTDAVLQQTACEIEKAMGIYPNQKGVLSSFEEWWGNQVGVSDWPAEGPEGQAKEFARKAWIEAHGR